jgi:hypothetical protein
MPALAIAALLVLHQVPPTDGAATGLSLGVGTDFPVAAGAYVRAEVGPRIQLGLSVGWMPGAYVDAVNAVLTTFDVYGDTSARLIAATLSDSLSARAQVGWRPVASSGFYVTGGYGFLGLGGRLTSTELLTTVTGRTLDNPLLERVGVNASNRLHQALLELGWRFRLSHALQLEAALGGFYTFAADSSLRLGDRPELASDFQPLRSAAESWLDSRIERWVHGGTLSLRVYFHVP